MVVAVTAGKMNSGFLSRRAVVFLAGLGVAAFASPLAAQTISSAANQTFNVGDPSTTASAITITDANGKIKPGNGIWIHIPQSLAMRWDNTVSTVTITGSAASRVSTTPTYLPGDSVVLITVTANFLGGDQITISGLAFTSFTATGGPASLFLEAGVVTNAADDKTKTISSGNITMISAANQLFTVGDPAVNMSTITVTDGLTPTITAANDI